MIVAPAQCHIRQNHHLGGRRPAWPSRSCSLERPAAVDGHGGGRIRIRVLGNGVGRSEPVLTSNNVVKTSVLVASGSSCCPAALPGRLDDFALPPPSPSTTVVVVNADAASCLEALALPPPPPPRHPMQHHPSLISSLTRPTSRPPHNLIVVFLGAASNASLFVVHGPSSRSPSPPCHLPHHQR